MSDNILKTSAEWLKSDCPEITILDPDGWDRKNYEYSFNIEKVDFEEFQQRLVESTCMRNKKR